MKERKIYVLDLHESIEIGEGSCVLRVPGVWIYSNYGTDDNYNYFETNTFVPFNNEFQFTPFKNKEKK